MRVMRLVTLLLLITSVYALPAVIGPPNVEAVRAQPDGGSSVHGVATYDNDNEHDCQTYDDNDNDLGPNLIKDLLQDFCNFEDERDVEIDNLDELIGEVIEAKREARTPLTQAERDARRAQLRGLVREAIEARVAARAGQETTVALSGDRVALRLFPTLARNLTVVLRLLDPSDAPSIPGQRVGHLVFELRALASDGTEVTTLPAEARLSATYTDEEAAGLAKALLVIARLNPSTGEWQQAPKLAGDPNNNYVSATITDLGTYAVYQP
jgi:hypothetical protein